jgi:prepilin-type N-terminal cleavage/methylation domain-containing protein
MKVINFIFYRKGFSLVEVVTAIAVLTLCIMALLSTYYSIYKLQNKAMHDTLLQRKAETIFFTKIYPNVDLIYIQENLYNLLNKDEDLKKYIEIDEISVIDHSPYITKIYATPLPNVYNFPKTKQGYTITIKYKILKTKAKKTTEIYIPVIVNTTHSDGSCSSGGPRGTLTTNVKKSF